MRGLRFSIAGIGLGILAVTAGCSRTPSKTGDSASAVEAAASPAPAPTQNGAPAAGATRSKRALLVGINQYKHKNALSTLAGCVNDINRMKAVLVSRFEFPEQNVRMLRDAQATRAGIIRAIQEHLITGAKNNDIVVFHFSGHGSQMRDTNGDEPDQKDETIVPYDSRDPEGKIFDINDDELRGLFSQLGAKTRNITVIIDACHSGSMMRNAVTRARRAPEDERKPPAQPASFAVTTRGVNSSGFAPGQIDYVLITASQDKQLSFEHFAEGKENGALSYFLTASLMKMPGSATFRQLMDVVAPQVNGQYPNQMPQLEGRNSDFALFGDREYPSEPYYTATPLAAAKATLNAGEVHGMTPGSVFDVYRPGTRTFAPPAQPVAKLKLTSVGTFTAEGTVAGAAKIDAGARAVEREHAFGGFQLRVLMSGATNSPQAQALRQAVQDVPTVKLLDTRASCDIQVRLEGNRYLTLTADGLSASPPVDFSAPGAAEHVADQLAQWARWFAVLRISNTSSGFPIELDVKARRGSVLSGLAARFNRADARLNDGEQIEITVSNRSPKNLFVTILDLSSDGSIDVIYPGSDIDVASELLAENSNLTRTTSVFVPPGRTFVTDVLKVFASTRQIDLRPLRQKRIRSATAAGGETDPLSALLRDATYGTRGVRPVDLGEWTTTQRTIFTQRSR